MMSLDLDSKRRLKMTIVDIPSFTFEKIHHKNLQSSIVTLYKRDTWTEIRNLEKTRIKIQRREAYMSLFIDPDILYSYQVVLKMSLDLYSKCRIKMTTVDIPSFTSEKLHHKNLQSSIVTLYGRDTWTEIRNLEKARIKIQRREADLTTYDLFSSLQVVLKMSLDLDSKHN